MPSSLASSSSPSSSGDGSHLRPWLLVGLGNPGKMYQGTRHNVGFEMIDAISEVEGIPLSTMHSKAMFGKGWSTRLIFQDTLESSTSDA